MVSLNLVNEVFNRLELVLSAVLVYSLHQVVKDVAAVVFLNSHNQERLEVISPRTLKNNRVQFLHSRSLELLLRLDYVEHKLSVF